MSYSVMLYCNRNTVLSYSVTLHRNQNSIVSYSDADVSYPVVIYRNLYAVVSYSVTRYRNLNGIVSCCYIVLDATMSYPKCGRRLSKYVKYDHYSVPCLGALRVSVLLVLYLLDVLCLLKVIYLRFPTGLTVSRRMCMLSLLS